MRRSVSFVAVIAALSCSAVAGASTSTPRAVQQAGSAQQGGEARQTKPNNFERPAGGAADVNPPAQIAVSPGRFEVVIDGARPVVQSLRLMNFSSDEIDIRITVAPWDLDESNKVRILEPDEQSLDQWLLINPREFTVPAQSTQTVRFAIRPRTEPSPGEHRAMIYLEEVPRQVPAGTVKLAFKLGVAVYGYAGETTRTASLDGVQVAADDEYVAAGFGVTNSGNAHVRLGGSYAIWPLEQHDAAATMASLADFDVDAGELGAPFVAAGGLPNTPILGGTTRQLLVTHEHELPAGRYVLGYFGTLGDVPIADVVEFSVPVRPTTATANQQQDQDAQ